MGYVNKVTLLGRIGQDLELRHAGTHQVLEISIATSETWKDNDGNKKDKTEWHKVVFWNKQAEIIAQFFKKGSQIYVEGSLTTEEWQDKEGNKRYTTKVKGQNFQFIDKRDDSAPSSPQSNPQTPPAGGKDFIEDDIPF